MREIDFEQRAQRIIRVFFFFLDLRLLKHASRDGDRKIIVVNIYTNVKTMLLWNLWISDQNTTSFFFCSKSWYNIQPLNCITYYYVYLHNSKHCYSKISILSAERNDFCIWKSGQSLAFGGTPHINLHMILTYLHHFAELCIEEAHTPLL